MVEGERVGEEGNYANFIYNLINIMKTRIIVVLLLILVIAGGTIYWFQKNKDITPDTNLQISTNDWRAYQNKEYGFEIKLPKTWSVTAQNDGFLINPDIPGPRDSFYAPTQLSIWDNKENLSIPDWFLKNYPKNEKDLNNFSSINIDSSDTAMAWYHENDSLKTYTYYIKKGDKIYEFSLTDIQENLANENEMMKTIVSTFKFIEE